MNYRKILAKYSVLKKFFEKKLDKRIGMRYNN